MPRVIGNIPSNKWERVVRDKLQAQCPSDWIVLCGVDWVRRSGSYVRSGEADFVILIPHRGMVVVEVKGSKRFWIDEDGAWYREEHGQPVRLEKSPHKQASDNMHELVDVICRAHKRKNFPGSFAHVVAYPNGELSIAPSTYDRSTIVDRRDLNDLPERIIGALNAAGPRRKEDELDSRLVWSYARTLLGGDFKIVPAVGSDVEEETGVSRIEQLTRQQAAALKGIYMFPSVAVNGPAGSGKTVLAMWRLRELVDSRRNAIYVCYNRKLADRLKHLHPELRNQIWNVDRLFLQIAGNQTSVQGDTTQFFRETLPELTIGAIEREEQDLFDAIIIDEGQDFSELQICVLQELLNPNSETNWLLFCDWEQDLYDVRERKTTFADLEFRLFHNCRNTRLVNRGTNRLVGSIVESVPGAPEGVDPIVIRARTGTGVVNEIWKLAKSWKPSGSVAILSPVRIERSVLVEKRHAHGLFLSESVEDLDDPKKIVFSTVKGFKGLEAGSVILLEPPIPSHNSFFTRADLYVACTRPATNLAVITSSPEVADWFHERPREI